MRILYFDIDTTRPDHLGCYGYHRDTSPNFDRIAEDGIRFDSCYVSDAPCLPSRAGMFSGQFGIHNGVVNHGGLAADPFPVGRERMFKTVGARPGFIESVAQQGMYPVSVSPFAERHSAWWFYAGWREMYNTGKGGGESAEEVMPTVFDWVRRNAKREDWMLHVNVWDPHTRYRAPESFGHPFKNDPIDPWYTEEIRQAQWNSFGPGTPQEPGGAYGAPLPPKCTRMTEQVTSMDDYRTWIDGYDTGIRYADHYFGQLMNALADAGVLDDTAIIITSDHGENFGELGVIGDHALADHVTSRVPMIVKWPGLPAGRVDTGLYNQCDIAASVIELLDGEVPECWDGRSFADAMKAGENSGRDYVVFSQCAWSCMRGVRWDDNVFIRTYHTGLKNLPQRMLFDIAADPHEQNNLVSDQPALADHGDALLSEWWQEMMATSATGTDPLATVLQEGGPYHTRDRLADYCERLRATGRARHADFLEAHPTGLVEG